VNKATKIAIAIVGLLLIVCVIGLWSLVNRTQQELAGQRERAVTEANEVLVLVASGWERGDFELRTSADFEKNVGDLDAKLAEWRQAYGTLVSGEAKLLDFEPVTGDPPLLVARFEAEAEFEKGPALVQITLTREPRNSWMLSDLDVRPRP
jgi:hypothetical protein